MIGRIAMLSLHTSPLDQPGAGSSGGMNVYVRELSQALAAQDVPVDVFTRSPGGPQIVDDGEGVRVIGIPAGPPGPVAKQELANLVPALICGIAGVAAEEGHGYDVVHSHYWSSGLAAKRLARRWDAPHVHMFHTLARAKARYAGTAIDLRRSQVEERLLDTADAIVVSNQVERAQLMDLYGQRRAPIATIPCGIALAPFKPAPAPAPGRFRVLALGRIERLKNFGLLLAAVAEACAQDNRFAREVEVTIAGGASADEPEVLEELYAQVRQLGIGAQVHFVGAVPHGRVPALYRQADVCVVPSRHESFGLVALEAMASGLPVIATRTGGLQVTVLDEVTGFLVPPDEPGKMAQRLLTLWSSPALRTAMGLRGARAAEHFAWPEVAGRMLCLYQSLLAEERGVGRSR
jgi:D-inositol-3-phosphate glycosyltransferase